MPARRKKVPSGKKLSATGEPTPEIREESRPVTQVVEVIEDESSAGTSESSAAMPATPMENEIPITEPEDAGPDVTVATAQNVPDEPVTHKSMVEELYNERRAPTVMPEISMHKGSSKKSFVVWAIVTIVIALITGLILFSVTKKGSGGSALFARPTPTPTPALAALPTPTPVAIDKTKITIEVLNGGGTPGAAGKMKTFLESKGYTVASTGNTDAYTFDLTEIHGKSTMTDAVASLKADLKDTYSLGTVAADLDASASADVNVIVGKE